MSSNASKILKIGEENKQKTYTALVWSSQPVTAEQLKFLDDIRDLKIAQLKDSNMGIYYITGHWLLMNAQYTVWVYYTVYIDGKHL